MAFQFFTRKSKIINDFFFSIGTTYYDIHISVGNVSWTVRKRFKEFVELHNKLVSGQSIGRDLLPPKKVKHPKNVINRSENWLIIIILIQGYW